MSANYGDFYEGVAPQARTMGMELTDLLETVQFVQGRLDGPQATVIPLTRELRALKSRVVSSAELLASLQNISDVRLFASFGLFMAYF